MYKIKVFFARNGACNTIACKFQFSCAFGRMLPKRRRKCAQATISSILGVLVFTVFFRSAHDTAKIVDRRQGGDTAEIWSILKNTSNLWSNENQSFVQRLRAQQDWYRRIAATDYVRKSPVKTIWLEHDLSYLYGNELKLRCPLEPSFEDRCLVKQIPFHEKLGSYLFPTEGTMDAVISVINWEKRYFDYHYEDSFKRVLHIVHALEPPLVAQAAVLPKNPVIASYLFASHIPIPYGFYDPELKNEDFPPTSRLEKTLETKIYLAAALISNCNAEDRLAYIEELEGYTDAEVHVYGKCGSHSCTNDCLEMLEQHYWFYLAFENAQCENYITEKLFQNALMHNIVPVVRGGTKEDYLALAPPNSFIYAGDFENPAALGAYLTELTRPENRDKYLSFLSWKEMKAGAIISSEAWEDFFCRVCGLLYYSELILPPPIFNEAVERGKADETINWEEVNKCLPQKLEARW